MSELRSPRVLVVGSGAIGSFYGAILARAGCEVGVVLRSEYETVRDQGLRIESPLGDLSFRPAAVYREVAECTAAPDYLLLCVKVVPGLDRAALIRPAVGEGTCIVLIENGIDIEPEIAAAYPRNPLTSALAFIGVSRVAPGRVRHKAFGHLVLGDYPRGIGASTERLSGLLRDGGIKTYPTETVIGERWRKCVWNSAFNPVSVLAGGADTRSIIECPDGGALILGLMHEVLAIAAADGYPLPPELPGRSLEGTRDMDAYHTSMALDFLNGRPMETEAILGNTVRKARELGVAAPQLETLYALMQLREATLASPPQAD